MKNRLFWRLCAIIALGTVLLFWAIDWLTHQTETSMSYLSEEHQEELVSYGRQAEKIYQVKGEAALAQWLNVLQEKENTWAAVVDTRLDLFANSTMLPAFIDHFRLGRSVEWKIHLDMNYNPVMEVPFLDAHTHFLIQLPQRMRPGAFLPYADLALQIALPLILLCILSLVLYQHVMTPLRKLETATREFSKGKLDVRVNASMPDRNDELTALAITFDQMAERISQLIYNQRQLLADMSHELRTPLTRIDMAVDFVEQGLNPKEAVERLRYESANMRELVEDSLTLAWLNTESPLLQKENFDLVELVQVICEDARFEYPDRELVTNLPQQAPLKQSCQQALGQAIENIVRNALRYTPKDCQVVVALIKDKGRYKLDIKDQGPGVPEEMLTDIFKPFFRVDKSKTGSKPSDSDNKPGGFGLGLALAQRQIAAVGGSIIATNYQSDDKRVSGLKMGIELTVVA